MICVEFTAFCDLRDDLRIRLATHPYSSSGFGNLRRLASPFGQGFILKRFVFIRSIIIYIYQLFIFSTDTGLTALCNEKCVCPIKGMNPVCGTDQLTYFSPCHAGCRSFSGGVMSLFLCLVLVNSLWSCENTIFRH